MAVFHLKGMGHRQRIEFLCLFGFGLCLNAVFAVWWFNLDHVPGNFSGWWHVFDYILYFILSYIVWLQIAMEIFSWYISSYAKHPDHAVKPEPGLRVAYLTAFVPGSEPYDMLENTLKAMVAVDYPHDTWLLDEGNDPEAIRICKKLGVKHHSRHGKEHFNTNGGKFAKKTKGGNYNSWLHHYDADYDIVAQHDMDFIPRKDFLTRTLGYFKDPNVAFVGTPQVYGNTDASWIAQGAAEQTYGFYGPLQKGFYGHDMTLLVGANHLMRTEAYRDIDGYTAHITEDMLTGIKLYSRDGRWKSVYVPEALLIGEGPTTWSAYFGQQMRWAYGCMDIAFRHSPKLFNTMSFQHVFNYFWIQQFYFSGVAQVLGIVMLSLYFFLGITSANMTLLPVLVLYIPIMVYQQLFQLWLQQFNIDPKTERGLFLRGKLLFIAAWPVFFLAFIGAVRNKRLTYVVTPKVGGVSENSRMYTPELFILHFVLGSITWAGIVAGIYRGNDSEVMIFWALLNTIFMYYFFLAEALPPVIFSWRQSLFGRKKHVT